MKHARDREHTLARVSMDHVVYRMRERVAQLVCVVKIADRERVCRSDLSEHVEFSRRPAIFAVHPVIEMKLKYPVGR